MSETEKQINAASLLAYIERLDAEIAELEALVAQLEARIAKLKVSGKAIPELPAMMEELETSKTKLEGLHKRRKELALISYNQSILEFETLQNDIKNAMQTDEKDLLKIYRQLVDDIDSAFKRFERFYAKACGAELPESERPVLAIDTRNRRTIFDTAQQGLKPYFDGRLKAYVAQATLPAKQLVQKTQREAGAEKPALNFVSLESRMVSFDE